MGECFQGIIILVLTSIDCRDVCACELMGSNTVCLGMGVAVGMG